MEVVHFEVAVSPELGNAGASLLGELEGEVPRASGQVVSING